jgi:transcription antitermination factor NusG
MSSGCQTWATTVTPFIVTEPPEHWYAILTRSRHEKAVVSRLQERGFTAFLPLVRESRAWSDRTKIVDLPLFPGYVFVRTRPTNENKVRALRVDGVVQFIGARGEATAIPDEQIASVRALLTHQLKYTLHPFLKLGQRVRVRGGALRGLEGVLIARDGERALVVSIDAIERSLAIRLEGYDVEAA